MKFEKRNPNGIRYAQYADHRDMAVWCMEEIDRMNTVVQEMHRYGKNQKIPWLQLSAYRTTVTRKESSGKEDEVQLKESEEVVDDSNDAEDINVDDRQMQQQYM